ncbi:sigma 54-interacting transcriptional regulator [Myxococcota bacterium]
MSRDQDSTAATEAMDPREVQLEGCRIRVLEGPDAGSDFDLPSGAATIGSSSSCDWSLSDPTVSGSHVRVAIVEGGIEVTDLESTNGTFYLETKIQKAVLAHGAVLNIGRTRLSLSSREPPAGANYSQRTGYGELIGSAPAMRRLYALLERIEPVDYTVLIRGPTGAGKELVAREIHNHSKRATKPFEVFDCGAVPSNLAESLLFGHTRGAFTGALTSHRGVFERAHQGTVFLDEIGELPLELQPKLLRILETREVHPLGGDKGQPVDVRVVAATNRDITREVEEGRFREDLYFRLNVVTLEIPPLRARREDIPEMVRYFVAELGDNKLEISPLTLELFTSAYDWPGNVRELRNAIARVLCLGSPPESIDHQEPLAAAPEVDIDATYQQAKKRLVDAFERDYFVAQLTRSGNNIAQAARLAGVDRSYFKRMLKRHGLLDQVRKATTDD